LATASVLVGRVIIKGSRPGRRNFRVNGRPTRGVGRPN
jgi:hypothetical protein